MPKLKDTDEVLVYPYGGWHYHIKGCWMATTEMAYKQDNYIPVTYKDVRDKLKTNMGYKYEPDGCVLRYENDLPLNPHPLLRMVK